MVSDAIIVYQGHSNNDERHEDEHSDHHHDEHKNEHKHSEPETQDSGHYDIILTQDLEFPKDKKLRQVRTSLFSLFPDTHSFDIEIVSDSKQSRYSLTHKKDRLSLKGY